MVLITVANILEIHGIRKKREHDDLFAEMSECNNIIVSMSLLSTESFTDVFSVHTAVNQIVHIRENR